MDIADVLHAMRVLGEHYKDSPHRTVDWHVVTPEGESLPLRDVYHYAAKVDISSVSNDVARRKFEDLGFEVVNLHRLKYSSANDVGRGFWWVNNKQTFKAEFEGGYIWSPKVNKNGARNQTYDNLKLIQPSDVVVAYAGAQIKAIGVATGSFKEAPKPEEFGQAGANWSNSGWLVPIEWTSLTEPVSPKAYIGRIQPLLPKKNSPLQANGNGNQGCYLAAISPELGQLVLDIVGLECPGAVEAIEDLEQQVEADAVEQAIQSAEDISTTEKEQLVRSRRGQGLFRQRVLAIETRCRLTGVRDQSFLIASHIKPWKYCSNSDRLNGHNGLMLAPHVDRLFDRGWISFSDDGSLMVVEKALPILEAWGINPTSTTGTFTEAQRAYLAFHRQKVFKG